MRWLNNELACGRAPKDYSDLSDMHLFTSTNRYVYLQDTFISLPPSNKILMIDGYVHIYMAISG